MSCGILKRALSLENSVAVPAKRRRCDTELLNFPATSAAQNTTHYSSIFMAAQDSPFKIEQNIIFQIKSLHKRKQLHLVSSPEPKAVNLTEMDLNSGKTLFTFNQVLLICKQKLLEREKDMREKYDEFLQLKLAEQYDDFVKFTHDQIQRNHGVKPTYLS